MTSSSGESSILLGSTSLIISNPPRSRWSHRKKERRYGWRYTIDRPNEEDWTSPYSWTSNAMKWWASTCRLVVMLPWNPYQTTYHLPTPSNLKRYLTQIWKGWAWEANFLSVYQDRGSRKPKGPKTLSMPGPWTVSKPSGLRSTTRCGDAPVHVGPVRGPSW